MQRDIPLGFSRDLSEDLHSFSFPVCYLWLWVQHVGGLRAKPCCRPTPVCTSRICSIQAHSTHRKWHTSTHFSLMEWVVSGSSAIHFLQVRERGRKQRAGRAFLWNYIGSLLGSRTQQHSHFRFSLHVLAQGTLTASPGPDVCEWGGYCTLPDPAEGGLSPCRLTLGSSPVVPSTAHLAGTHGSSPSHSSSPWSLNNYWLRVRGTCAGLEMDVPFLFLRLACPGKIYVLEVSLGFIFGLWNSAAPGYFLRPPFPALALGLLPLPGCPCPFPSRLPVRALPTPPARILFTNVALTQSAWPLRLCLQQLLVSYSSGSSWGTGSTSHARDSEWTGWTLRRGACHFLAVCLQAAWRVRGGVMGRNEGEHTQGLSAVLARRMGPPLWASVVLTAVHALDGAAGQGHQAAGTQETPKQVEVSAQIHRERQPHCRRGCLRATYSPRAILWSDLTHQHPVCLHFPFDLTFRRWCFPCLYGHINKGVYWSVREVLRRVQMWIMRSSECSRLLWGTTSPGGEARQEVIRCQVSSPENRGFWSSENRSPECLKFDWSPRWTRAFQIFLRS